MLGYGERVSTKPTDDIICQSNSAQMKMQAGDHSAGLPRGVPLFIFPKVPLAPYGHQRGGRGRGLGVHNDGLTLPLWTVFTVMNVWMISEISVA